MASKFTITAELNLQTKNLNQVVNNLRQQFQGANLNVKIKDLAQAQAKMQALGKTAQGTQKNINSLGSSIAAAAKRFSAITLATGTLVGLTRAIKNAVGEAIEFERELVKISQATGQSISQLSNLKREINSVSSSFGVSSKELILAARELTQAGFAADKVAGSLKILAQTELAATFDSIADTTEGAIAVLNQFGKEAQRTGREVEFLEKSFSAINQVSKEFAVESSDLVTAVRTTGAAFESAGGNLNELLALFTSVRSTTRESAESISTGFRTIFTRTQRLDTINNLRALGVELQDVEGKFVGPMEAVKRLSTALNSIDPRDFRFNLIVEELGGFRQVSKVIPLIQQFATTQRALNVAQSSSGSLAKDAATAQQSLAVQIQKTREEFLRFIRDLTESSSFKSFSSNILGIANAFIKVGDSIKPLIPLIGSFAAFKLGMTLLPGLKSLGGARKNAGGAVHHFATGGLVPGQGNGDTVPAQLTPGEFVIRKSSVQKLGADNLARMNQTAKYESGTGPTGARKRDLQTVKANIKAVDYADPTKIEEDNIKTPVAPFQVGAAFLRPAGKKSDTTGFIPIPKDYEIDKTQDSKVLGGGFYNAFVNDKGKRGVYYQLHSRSLPEETSSAVEDKILSKVVEAVDESADIFSAMIGVKASDEKLGNIIKKANIDQISGNIFEAMLLNMDAPFDSADISSVSFDFKNGLGNVSKVFGDSGGILQNIPTDARNSYTTDSLAKIPPKIDRLVKEEIDKVTVKGNIESYEKDKVSYLRGLNDKSLDTLKKDKVLQSLMPDGVTSAGIKALAESTGVKLKTGPLYKFFAKGGLTEVPWMSSGGPTGTDTIPAMLTPGEFVINKKSAEAIGYSNLDRMNKVAKFADGGPVHMARGGGMYTSMAGGSSYAAKAASQNIPGAAPAVPSQQATTKVNNSFLKLSNNAILLGTGLTGVISQMGIFEKSIADMISASTATFTAIKGIGDNLVGMGAKIAGKDKGGNQKYEQLFKGVSAGLTGYAAAQSASAAALSYFANTAEKEGQKFASAVEALTKGVGTTEKQLYDALNAQLEAAETVRAGQSRTTKTAGLAAGVAGGAVGFALGGPIGAMIGASIATSVTEYLSTQLTSQDVSKQAKALSEAMFSATNSAREFNKFAEKMDKATPEEISRQGRTLAQEYKYQQERLAQFTPEVLKNASDTTVQAFNSVSEAARATAQNLEKIIGQEQVQATKKSAELVNLGFIPDIKKLAEPGLALIRQQTEAKYEGRISQTTGAEKQNLIEQRKTEVNREQERYTRELTASAQQQIKMYRTLKMEEAIRRRLIGTLQQENAFTAMLERTAASLADLDDAVSNVEAAFSDSVTGFKSKFNTKIFDMKFPDSNELNNALDPIRKLGPMGETLAKSLLDINKVAPNLRAKLEEMAKAGQGFDVKKFVSDAFGVDVSGAVGDALVKMIENTIKPTEGSNATGAQSMSLAVEETRERIVKMFESFSNEFKDKAKQHIQNLEAAYAKENEILQKINDSRTKQLDLVVQGIDSYSKYIDAVAKARGRDLTLIEKNNIRSMRQYALVGNLGGNVEAIGRELAAARKKLAGGVEGQERSNTVFAANRLETALKQLADQSDKTADTLSEIEKIRQQRESFKDYTSSYTFGTRQEREQMNKAAMGLQMGMAAGTTEAIPENLRRDVLSLLQQFKDIRAFNGMTGNEVIGRFNANALMQQGNVVGAQMALTNSSPMEERLIGELRKIFLVQLAAQKELFKQENTRQEMLMQKFDENRDIIKKLDATLQQLIEEMRLKAANPAIVGAETGIMPNARQTPLEFFQGNPAFNPSAPKKDIRQLQPVENRPFGEGMVPLPEGAAGKLDIDNIAATNRVIDDFGQAISTSDQKIYEFTARLENLVKVMEQNSDRFKQEEENKKQTEHNKKRDESNANTFWQDMARLPKDFMSSVGYIFGANDKPRWQNRAIGGLIYRADGGSIFQPKGTDTVPAMLTPGEFVIKKSSVDKIGVDTLKNINAGHYASGGLVSYLQFGGMSGEDKIDGLMKKVAKLEEKEKTLEKKNIDNERKIKELENQNARMKQILPLAEEVKRKTEKSSMRSSEMGSDPAIDMFMSMMGMGGMGMGFGGGGGQRRIKGGREIARERAADRKFEKGNKAFEDILPNFEEAKAPKRNVLNMGGSRQQIRAREHAAKRLEQKEAANNFNPNVDQMMNENGEMINAGNGPAGKNSKTPFMLGNADETNKANERKYGPAYAKAVENIQKAKLENVAPEVTLTSAGGLERREKTNASPDMAFKINTLKSKYTDQKGNLVPDAEAKANEQINSFIPGAKPTDQRNPFTDVSIKKEGGEQGVQRQLRAKIDAAAMARAQLEQAEKTGEAMSPDARINLENRIVEAHKLGLADSVLERQSKVIQTKEGGFTFAAEEKKGNLPQKGQIWNPTTKQFEMQQNSGPGKRPGPGYMWDSKANDGKGGWVPPEAKVVPPNATADTGVAAPQAPVQTPEQRLREVNALIDLHNKGKMGSSGLKGADELQSLANERENLMSMVRENKELTNVGAAAEFKKSEQARIDKKYKKLQSKENFDSFFGMGSYNPTNSPTYEKNLEEITAKREAIRSHREAIADTSNITPMKVEDIIPQRIVPSADEIKKNASEQFRLQKDLESSRALISGAEFDKKVDQNTSIGKNITDIFQVAGNAIFNDKSISKVGHQAVATIQDSVLAEEGRDFKSNIKKNMNLRQQLQGFASGGSTDTVPAMLTPGEFVMNKGAVGKYGKGFMEQLNRGGVVGFANGGHVGYYAGGGTVSGGSGGDLASKISEFTKQFQDLASQLSGLTVTHTVRVDGQLNIGGIDGNAIATQIRDGIANYVIDKINAKKGNPSQSTDPTKPPQ